MSEWKPQRGGRLSVLAKLQQRCPALVAFVLFSATVNIISVLAMIINYLQCLALKYMPQVHSVLWHIPHFRAHNTISVALPLCSVASESGPSLVQFYFHLLLCTVVYQKACQDRRRFKQSHPIIILLFRFRKEPILNLLKTARCKIY